MGLSKKQVIKNLMLSVPTDTLYLLLNVKVGKLKHTIFRSLAKLPSILVG